jgi:hypothetical protein
MVQVQKISYLPAAEVFAVLGVVFGIISGILILITGTAAGGIIGSGFGVIGLVLSIVAGAIEGFIGGAVFALLYNFVIVRFIKLEVN